MVKVPKCIKIGKTGGKKSNIMLIYEEINNKNMFLGIGPNLFMVICHKTLPISLPAIFTAFNCLLSRLVEHILSHYI